MKNDERKNDIILAQWQTCVEMANAVSQRRDTMNTIFVTLNLAVLTAVSVIWEIKLIAILIAGLIICVLWAYLIEHYKQLNVTKYEIINELENKLPCHPFNDEWKRLKSNKKYLDGTKLEKVLPVVFFIMYIFIEIIQLKTIM